MVRGEFFQQDVPLFWKKKCRRHIVRNLVSKRNIYLKEKHSKVDTDRVNKRKWFCATMITEHHHRNRDCCEVCVTMNYITKVEHLTYLRVFMILMRFCTIFFPTFWGKKYMSCTTTNNWCPTYLWFFLQIFLFLLFFKITYSCSLQFCFSFSFGC